MSILFKRKYVTFITNIALIFIVVGVAAVCFAPYGAMPASVNTPYYNGDANSDKISLMFNVYEGADIVGGILDILKKHEKKATFFVGGCFADDNAELLCRMVEEGHEIGNHGYFHLDHDKISKERNIEEIENTGKVIYALCGVKPTLFAPPSGAYNSTTLEVAQKLGYTVVMWSKDTIDWRDESREKVYTRATKNTKGGDLVLMHPKRHTLDALEDILDYYENAGLKQTTVSDNLFGD